MIRAEIVMQAGSGGAAQGDMLTNIENIWGSAHNDRLTGDAFKNLFAGFEGADAIDGGDYRQSVTGITIGLDGFTLEWNSGCLWSNHLTG